MDFSETWKVFAHELAHNLNAEHVESLGDCDLTLMNGMLYPGVQSRFCQTSINEIISFVSQYGECLQRIEKPNEIKFDFDRDGKSDISIFRPSNGFWYVMKSSGGFSFVKWGLTRDEVVPADYDGDGRTDYAVYREGNPVNSSGIANNTWYILRSSDNTFLIRDLGKSAITQGDMPVPADYDGDGRDDLAVYRLSDYIGAPGYFMILQSSDESIVVK